ncbi:uncharacterized protein LOC111113553 [Crassostrea virginica]
MEILTSILHYFSSHLLDTCREGPEDDSIGPHNVHWVINLPSKSRDNIIALLTVAATQAGIDRSTLYFIPEVDSILAVARNLHKEKSVNESDQNWCFCDIGGEKKNIKFIKNSNFNLNTFFFQKCIMIKSHSCSKIIYN